MSAYEGYPVKMECVGKAEWFQLGWQISVHWPLFNLNFILDSIVPYMGNERGLL